MRTAILACVLLAATGASSWSHAAAPAASKERLRRLVHLPRLSLVTGLSFDPARGFVLNPDRPTVLDEVGKVRKTLEGNAGDAPRYARLGQLSESIGNHHEARQAFAKAVELFRKQGIDQGNDGAALAGFGLALLGLGDLDAAERVLRRGVEVAPGVEAIHGALGRLLVTQALVALSTGPAGGSFNPLAALQAGDDSRARLAPGQAEKAQAKIDEALRAYDRAIACDPEDPEPYAGRAGARAFQNLVRCLLDAGAGTEAAPRSLRLARAMYPPEALADLRQVARLAPKDPQALAVAILFELLCSALDHGSTQLGAFGTSESWASLPETLRQSVRVSLAQIEELSQSAEGPRAAAALEMLGTLQCLVVNDLVGAERSLRRAVALDPRRTQAWDLLVYILVSTKRPELLLSVCEDRFKGEDTPRARLLVAKAYELLSDWDRVLVACEALQRRYPDDLYANLAFAAAVLRTIDGEVALGRVAQLLAKAEKLAGNSPSAEQVVNLLFLRGLTLALDGQVEAARDQLKRVKDLDEDHEGLQEALEILGQW